MTSCADKVRYKKAQQALGACVRQSRMTPGASFRYYRCQFCDGYHTTSATQKTIKIAHEASHDDTARNPAR